jgi:hypothetical protein
MLATLLPGLREIRAPLVAGYLWCAVLWLVLESTVDRAAEDASGAVAGGARLVEALPDLGVLAVVSVAAYLLGALSLEASRPLAHALQKSIAAGFDHHVLWDDLTHRSPLQPSRAGRNALEDHAATVFAALLDSRRPLDATEGYRWVAMSMADAARIDERNYLLDVHGRDEHVTQVLEAHLAEWIEWELNLTATRLIEEHSELYATIDQLRAESDLRLATWLPLFVLGVAVATIGLSLPATVGTLVATFTLCALLVAQGLRREAAAADRIVDAIILGTVTAPIIEKVERAYGQLPAHPSAPSSDETLVGETIADAVDS